MALFQTIFSIIILYIALHCKFLQRAQYRMDKLKEEKLIFICNKQRNKHKDLKKCESANKTLENEHVLPEYTFKLLFAYFYILASIVITFRCSVLII